MAEQGFRKKALFICTHNSARSQMAAGLLKHLSGDRFEAFSAGTDPSRVNPFAVKTMAEIGVDISHHRSRHVGSFKGERFDYVITVCEQARESCPIYPGADHTLHWSFVDPSGASGNNGQKLEVFRTVRDQIKKRIEEFLGPVS